MKHDPQDGKGKAVTPSLVRPNSMMTQEGPECRAVSLPVNGLLGNPLSPGKVFCSKKPRSQEELQPTVTGNVPAQASSQGQSLHSRVASLRLIL